MDTGGDAMLLPFYCTLHDPPWKTQCLGTMPLGFLGGGGFWTLFAGLLMVNPATQKEGQGPPTGLRIWQVA